MLRDSFSRAGWTRSDRWIRTFLAAGIALFFMGCQNDLSRLIGDIPEKKDPEPKVSTFPESGSTQTEFTQIELTYTHLMSGVTFLENYVLSGDGVGTLEVDSIQDLGSNRYLLTLEGFPKTGTLTLTINNVADAAERPLDNPVLFWTLEIPGPEVTATPADQSKLNAISTVDLEYTITMLGADEITNYTVTNAGTGDLAITDLEVTDASQNQYRLIFSGTPGDGSTIITISDNVTDLSGNQLEDKTITYFTDITTPTITSTSPSDGSTAANVTSYRITFSEAVTGATTISNWVLGDLAAAGVSITSITELTSPANSYRANFNTSAVDANNLTVTINNIEDEAGNALSGSNSFSVSIDDQQPDISTLSITAGTELNSLTALQITYDQAVNGSETLSNYVLSGAGIGSLAITGATNGGVNIVDLAFSGTPGNGTIRISINNVTAVDNGLALSTDQIDYTGDIVQPNATFNPSGGVSGVIPEFIITYDEAMDVASATTPGNYTLAGTALGTVAITTVDDLGSNQFRLNLSGSYVDGALTLDIAGVTDPAGNAVNYTTPNYTIDAVPPTVDTTVPADGTSLTSLSIIDIDYSETMSGSLTLGNYILGGAGAATLSLDSVGTLGGNSVRLTLSGSVSNGPITLDFSGIEDVSGNTLTAFTLNLTGDFSGPSATTNPANGGFVNALTQIIVTYSETVTGGDTLGNYSLSGAGAAGLTLDSVADIGSDQFQIDVSGAVANGDITLNFVTANIQDTFTNTLVTTDITFTGDIDDPTFTPSLADSSLINALASVDIQYDEPMLNPMVAGNYTLSGAGVGTLAVSTISDLGSDEYRVNFTGTPGNGTVTLTMGGTLTDRATNTLAGNTVSYTADTIAPTKTVTPAQQAGVGDNITFMDVDYDETMDASAGVAGNYTLSGTGAGTLSVNSVTPMAGDVYRLNFTGTQNVSGGVLQLTISGVTDPTGNALSGTTHFVIAGPTKYRQLTFDNSSNAQNLNNFPVLIQLDGTRIDYASMEATGIDIRFYDSDGTTELNYEIEKWDNAGDSAVWVRVPRVDSNSTTDHIFMYYDGDSLTDDQNPGGVWTASYRAVYHFNDDPDGGVVTDSTSAGNDGTPQNMALANRINGNFSGYAYQLNGTDEYISVPDSATMELSTGVNFTIESYFYWNTTGTGFTPLIEKGNLDTDNYSLFMSGAGSARMTFEFTDSGNNFRSIIEGPLSYSDSSWISTAFAFNDTGNMTYFRKNAAVTDSQAQSNSLNSSITDEVWIGRINKVGINQYLDGNLDELRISNAIRSVQWLTAQERYYNDTFITFGAEQ